LDNLENNPGGKTWLLIKISTEKLPAILETNKPGRNRPQGIKVMATIMVKDHRGH
jgi:hypothetical protein